MAEIDHVSLIDELILERQKVVRLFGEIFFQLDALSIVHLAALADPSNFPFFIAHEGKDGGFHTIFK